MVFDDTFFVTGGGDGSGDSVPTHTGAGVGPKKGFRHIATVASACTSSDKRRPRSTPQNLPSDDQRNLFSRESPESTAEAASSKALLLTRRDVRTADASCLGHRHRRLCFRSEPIHDLVSATLRSIDPSGVYCMYHEWSNVKNRVLSSECVVLHPRGLCLFSTFMAGTRNNALIQSVHLSSFGRWLGALRL